MVAYKLLDMTLLPALSKNSRPRALPKNFLFILIFFCSLDLFVNNLTFKNQLEKKDVFSNDEENQLFRHMRNYDFFKIQNGPGSAVVKAPLLSQITLGQTVTKIKETNK